MEKGTETSVKQLQGSLKEAESVDEVKEAIVLAGAMTPVGAQLDVAIAKVSSVNASS